ncbi:MAG: VOC family protein [Spirochaetota bacterium]
MKLNHLGFAAKDLGKTVEAYLRMGFTKVHDDVKHHVPKNLLVQRVKLGETIIEIMQPAAPTKPCFVNDAFEASSDPVVLHHLCYDVEDIHKTVDGLRATGEYSLYEPITSGVFQKNLICFLRHSQIGLVEFFEWPKE